MLIQDHRPLQFLLSPWAWQGNQTIIDDGVRVLSEIAKKYESDPFDFQCDSPFDFSCTFRGTPPNQSQLLHVLEGLGFDLVGGVLLEMGEDWAIQVRKVEARDPLKVATVMDDLTSAVMEQAAKDGEDLQETAEQCEAAMAAALERFTLPMEQ